jgi:excisionase family DNA binding protein
MISTMSDERLLTVQDVADRLQVSIFYVRELLKDGRLRGLRIGGPRAGWRVTEEDLRAFIARARDETEPGARDDR